MWALDGGCAFEGLRGRPADMVAIWADSEGRISPAGREPDRRSGINSAGRESIHHPPSPRPDNTKMSATARPDLAELELPELEAALCGD